MGLAISGNNKRMVLLSMIQLSGGHCCISTKFDPLQNKISQRFFGGFEKHKDGKQLGVLLKCQNNSQ
jgi:hypothetical protein